MTEQINNKRNAYIIVGIIAADVFVTIFAKLLHNSFSIFELMIIFYEIGLLFTFLYLFKADKIKRDIINVMKLSCTMIFGVVVYSILTIGQTNIHSDTATATLLAQTELRYISFFPKSWCYANGAIWVLSIFTLHFSA